MAPAQRWRAVPISAAVLVATAGLAALLGVVPSGKRTASPALRRLATAEPVAKVSAEAGGSHETRQLMRSTDQRRGCFDRENKQNYFARNPFNRDSVEEDVHGERGDWAKCLPSPMQSVFCTHARSKGLNPDPLNDLPTENDASREWRGQMHDWHAGALYEKLLSLHENNCTHAELELTEAAKKAVG